MAAATTSLRSAKQSLRQSLRKTLKQMTVQQRKEKSLMLTEKVIMMKIQLRIKETQLLSHKAYQEASRISVYLSMPEEVDTSLIIEVRLCLYTIILHILHNCRISSNGRSM